jgi:hypothetical protein
MFHDWEDFYLVIGPASAGLIGLLFVVVTLTAGRERERILRGVALYMTPTALQFAVVMTLSAVIMAPGLGSLLAGTAVGICALLGLACAARAAWGIGRPRQGQPPPHWSDFWLYGAGPGVVYLGLCAAAIAIWTRAGWAAPGLAALLLILLLVGIRNAWDLVTSIAPGEAGQG